MAKRSSKAAGVGSLLLFGLFWNGLIGVFDVIIVRQKLQEMHARAHFEEVPARILSSHVQSTHDSEGGTTYKPVVQYEYEIAGRTFTSDRYAYSMWGTSDSSYASDVVAENAPGVETVALVDPNDPTEAVLDASGASFPALIVIFLTPFHCIGIGILAACFRAFRRRRWTDEDERRNEYVFIDNEERFVLRTPPVPSFYMFLGALAGLSFVCIFAMAFTMGMMAPKSAVVPVWLALVGASGWLMLWRRKVDSRPDRFLHVDRRRGLFSYPADALGEHLDKIERLEVRSTPTGTTVNDVPVHKHVFEVVVDGVHMDVFKHKGGPEDVAPIRALLEEALSIAPGGDDDRSTAAA